VGIETQQSTYVLFLLGAISITVLLASISVFSLSSMLNKFSYFLQALRSEIGSALLRKKRRQQISYMRQVC